LHISEGNFMCFDAVYKCLYDDKYWFSYLQLIKKNWNQFYSLPKINYFSISNTCSFAPNIRKLSR